MRKYIELFTGIILIVIFFCSCDKTNKQIVQTKIITDTIYIKTHDTVRMIAWEVPIIDSSIYKKYDSIRNEYFSVNYKLNRVRFYQNICNKNKSQNKFLLGWINRVLN